MLYCELLAKGQLLAFYFCQKLRFKMIKKYNMGKE
jgi:hypothetical protein